MPARSALPNLLSAARLLLTAPVVYAITSGRWRAAAALLVAAGLTDVLDGMLARRWKASTRLGAYLDPAADKTLQNGAFLALGLAGALPWWLVGLVFGRDLLILTGALVLWRLKRRRDFVPSAWGKWCTFAQILAATAAILERAWPHWGLSLALPLLVWLAAALTFWSGLHYARQAFH